MRNIPNLHAERYRVAGPPRSNCGRFEVPSPGVVLSVQVADGAGWDHVSVSLPHRCPTWQEMEHIRKVFFRDDECVMQLSVPRTQHVNTHEYCLHWWRPQTDEEIAQVRRTWEQAEPGEWCWGDLLSAGVIPRPPSNLV